jgi:hypothetical protein
VYKMEGIWDINMYEERGADELIVCLMITVAEDIDNAT